MVRVTYLLSAFFSLAAREVVLANSRQQRLDLKTFQDTCVRIASSISSASAVYFPPSEQYIADNSHWASSSDDLSACSIEPGTAHDVSTILRVVGETRTPFAVKGGGHNTNPGFSSTRGVHIAMTRFNQVIVNKSASTVEVGAGLVWDDVYGALDGTGLNVVGGRVAGVGVAGFILGGGYSWKTNQYGLAIDNVESFNLVLPDGTFQVVTHLNEDLWFGLRGGFNNFGIVTSFVLKAHPQGLVWGGFDIIPSMFFDEVNEAIVKFQQEVTDTRAMILPTYNSVFNLRSAAILLFYDGPEPPPGVFDDFLSIMGLPITSYSIPFIDFFTLLPSSNPFAGGRAYFNTISVLQYSGPFLDAIVNETTVWGEELSNLDGGGAVSYNVEPFDPGLFGFSQTPSAYPPDRSRPLFPMHIYFAWASPAHDPDIVDALRRSTDMLRAVAVADGQDVADALSYGNYALFGTPLERVYGANLERLRTIRSRIDPNGVMALAGGFKF